MLVYSFSAMDGGFLYDWSGKLLVCSGVINLIAIIIALIFLIRKKSALKRMGKNAEPLDKKHFIFIASVFLVEIVLAIILWTTNFKMVYPETLNSVIALFIINIVMLSAYIVIMLWKRKGFIFVCIALALIVVFVTVYTIGCLVVDPFIYQESPDGSAYKIIGIRVWRSGEITIPSTHNGKPVVRVVQDPLRNSGGSSYEHLTDLLFIIPYSIPGFIFAYVYTKSKNICIPISLHFIHNGIMMSLQILLLLLN
jgi:membrane protease YdiL (CAAX protease family)